MSIAKRLYEQKMYSTAKDQSAAAIFARIPKWQRPGYVPKKAPKKK